MIPKGIAHIPKRLPEILEDGENGLPGMLWHRENEQSRKLEAIAGMGPITASAMVATFELATFEKDAQAAYNNGDYTCFAKSIPTVVTFIADVSSRLSGR